MCCEYIIEIIAFRKREREREKMLPLGLVIRHVSK